MTSRNVLKHDVQSGIVVFLVALPLCLGIALASGAPLFSGVIAGIVGGVVIGFLSGSHVSVSGPAAGLAVIVATAIQDLGSFPAFLCAVFLAGALQLGLGILRTGFVADYVPNSVIKGMLAGIGAVIVLKQIPHALGRDKDYEGDLSFLEAGSNTFADIVAGVLSASTGAVIISLVSLVLLIAWDRAANNGYKMFQLIPGPLAVVLAGIGLNQWFGVLMPDWKLTDPEHLVTLPISTGLADFAGQFTFPDFSRIAEQRIWIAAATITVVGSLETLLSLEAADRLDPYRRISPANRELRAQGVGNMIAGLIGGLPITSVVVRTSANVFAGARTRMSAVIHGLLLLASVVLIPGFLGLTPLASLASILIVVGYRLTRPALYKSMFAAGWDQFLPFCLTAIAVVLTDLLTGVLIGMALGIFFVIRTNHHEAITLVHQGSDYLFRFNKDASFINKSELRSKLRKLPKNSSVLIDGTRALYIDHDILEVVQDFQQLAVYRNITVQLKHFDADLVPGEGLGH
ncbi:MAG: SulP family inorganic anion transporter [Bryobacteraceae bacterium]